MAVTAPFFSKYWFDMPNQKYREQYNRLARFLVNYPEQENVRFMKVC